MKTSELTRAALNWAVAKCEGYELNNQLFQSDLCYPSGLWEPSTNWAQGGPIIEREGTMFVKSAADHWHATWIRGAKAVTGEGPTLLVASMRAYVASKLGAEVDIPEELL